MTLIVEDGTGLDNAESYVTIAEFDTYWDNHGNPPELSGLSDTQKEVALRFGAEYQDMEYEPRFKGVRKLSTQARAFPRSGCSDQDMVAISSDTVPQRVKDANCESGYRYVKNSGELLADQANPGSVKKYAVKVGPVAKTLEYASGNSPQKAYPKVEELLRPYMHDETRLGRM